MKARQPVEPISVQPTLRQLEKRDITLGVCVAAREGYLTPLLVLPLKTLPALFSTLIDLYTITGQNSGWVTEEVWRLWVRDIFMLKRKGNSYNFQRQEHY
ncbi:hypothetical protein QOT17_023386 [Balamuthia mandrillaris]